MGASWTSKRQLCRFCSRQERRCNAKAITERIMAAGLWRSEGKTPEATVSARLYSDIKTNGDKSPFIKVGQQTFALRDCSVKPDDAGATTRDAQETRMSPSANAGFSFTDCALRVLEEFSGKKPMHYREITEKALQKGWLVTGGKTPEATMYPKYNGIRPIQMTYTLHGLFLMILEAIDVYPR